jgi:glycosyltransferase involved in cell wall biosynthesis
MNVLWLAPYPFAPAIHGGRIRLANLVRQTVDHGHRVEVWNVSEEDWDAGAVPDGVIVRWLPARRRDGWRAKLAALASPLPEEAWRAAHPSVAQALDTVAQGAFDVAIVEQAHLGAHADRLGQLSIPLVLDAQNIESLLTRQLARGAARAAHRARLAADAAKYARLERRLFASAAMVAVTSEQDAARARAMAPGAHVEVHRSGVDLEFFEWTDHSSAAGARMVMTGTLGYPPNLDAALWTHDAVLPAIRAAVPGATVSLVGHSAPDQLRRLHAPSAGFTVVGQVPDVRPYLADADTFLMPLRAGSGTRLKAVEALAAGIPIVSTALGVEGLGLVERGLVLLAERPDEFAAAVARLVSDEELRRRLSLEGRAYVEREFDWRRIGDGWVAALERVARSPTGGLPE